MPEEKLKEKGPQQVIRHIIFLLSRSQSPVISLSFELQSAAIPPDPSVLKKTEEKPFQTDFRSFMKPSSPAEASFRKMNFVIVGMTTGFLRGCMIILFVLNAA